MRNKAITILAVTAVLAIVAIGVGAPVSVTACSKSDVSAKSAAMDAASCKEAASKAAAAVTVGAHDCCKAAVAAAVDACVSGASGSCTKSASCKTVGQSACGSANTTPKSKVALGECCQKSVAAFEAKCAEYMGASMKTASAGAYSCTKDAGAAVSTKDALGYSSCTKSTETTSLAAIPYDDGKRVELTGSVACGHCDLKCLDNCQSVFKTADGKAYLLIENDMVEKMKDNKTDNGYKIVTVVRTMDGKKYLAVEKMSAL